MRTMRPPVSSYYQFIFLRSYLYLGVFVAIVLILGAGCSDFELGRAFEGEFNSQKNNKVIGEYCTSCHIHKEFDSVEHVAKVRLEYRRKLFRTTAECRICHYLEKQWIHNEVLRKTRRPQEANRGHFKEFEKENIKGLSKSRSKN